MIDARSPTTCASTTRTCTAACTRSRRRPTRPTTGARKRIAAFVGAEPRDDDLHQERDRGDQPRRLLVGPRERRPRRRGADHADGAPREHRALAGAVPRARRASCATWRSTSAASSRSTQLDAELARGDVRAGRVRARLERARHDQPGRRDRPRAARAAGAVSLIDGAQAVPQMPVDVERDRRRLLRLDRPQGARADGHRRAARPRASCSRRWSRS